MHCTELLENTHQPPTLQRPRREDQTGCDHRRDHTRHGLRCFLPPPSFSFHVNIIRAAWKSFPDTSSVFSRKPGPGTGSGAQLLGTEGAICWHPLGPSWETNAFPWYIRAQLRLWTSNHKAALQPGFPHWPHCKRESETCLEIQKCLGSCWERSNPFSALGFAGLCQGSDSLNIRKYLCYPNVHFSKPFALWAGRMKEEPHLHLSVPHRGKNV